MKNIVMSFSTFVLQAQLTCGTSHARISVPSHTICHAFIDVLPIFKILPCILVMKHESTHTHTHTQFVKT
jgi:hypothetical protein